MTCVPAHRRNGEPALGVEPAAAGTDVLPESAVASLQGFLEVAGPRGGARSEGLTSAGLVCLDGPTVSLQGFDASPASDDSLAAIRAAKARKAPRSLEAWNVLAVNDLGADAQQQFRERWEISENVPIGLVDPTAQGEEPVAQSDEDPTSRLDQSKVSAARPKGLTGQGARTGLLETGIAAGRPEFREGHVSFMEFEPQGFPVRSLPRPNGRHGTQAAGLAAGQNCGVAPAADSAVAAALTGGSGTAAQNLAGHTRLAPHNHAPPNSFPSSCSIANASLGTVGHHPYLYSSVKVGRNLGRSLLIATTGNSRRQGVGNHESLDRVRHRRRRRIGRFDRDRKPLQRLGYPVPAHGCWKAGLCVPREAAWSSLPGGMYGPMTGTSMAAPGVAGATALLVQRLQAVRCAAQRKPVPYRAAQACRSVAERRNGEHGCKRRLAHRHGQAGLGRHLKALDRAAYGKRAKMPSEAFLKELDAAIPGMHVTGVVSRQLPWSAGGAKTVLVAIRGAKRPLLAGKALIVDTNPQVFHVPLALESDAIQDAAKGASAAMAVGGWLGNGTWWQSGKSGWVSYGRDGIPSYRSSNSVRKALRGRSRCAARSAGAISPSAEERQPFADSDG